VHLIQKGTGRFIVGDHIGAFQPGQLILVGSNLPHHWISDLSPGEIIVDRDVVFQFHPQWLRECQDLMPELRALDPLVRRAARGIEFSGSAADDAARPLVAIGESDGLDRLGHILKLLTCLSATPAENQRLLANPWMAPADSHGVADVIDEVLTYVAEAAGQPVSLAEAAARVGMSPSTFSRYFSRSAGQSFSDTVRKMRLTQACQLLEQTEDPVAGIAFRVGYQNLSNFNRQFLGQYGVSPRSYRREHAEVGRIPR
jgi:AraC-like DNA-binding protein